MRNLKIENENIEIKVLIEAIYLKYGYDFRNYAKTSIKRRILRRLSLSGLKTISEMQHKILYDKQFFEILIQDFSIKVTNMFRDPSFYKSVRENIMPVLKELPFIKIWHAGCATGEEVYSMAILLKEEGLYDKTTIYATDFNEGVIKKAKDGIYPADRLKEFTYNYQKGGGQSSFADYYSSKYDYALINKALKKNIVFAEHNLVTDWVFGEMNMIICRNVLIYFNRDLQNRVIHLFRDSLCKDGFLCLGSKESIKFSEYSDDFVDFVKKEKIYRRK